MNPYETIYFPHDSIAYVAYQIWSWTGNEDSAGNWFAAINNLRSFALNAGFLDCLFGD